MDRSTPIVISSNSDEDDKPTTKSPNTPRRKSKKKKQIIDPPPKRNSPQKTQKVLPLKVFGKKAKQTEWMKHLSIPSTADETSKSSKVNKIASAGIK